MFSALRITRLIMVYHKEVICYKASVFLGWDRLAHRISVKLSVQDYNLAEVVGRCNVFFVIHVVVLHSKESLDPIIIGDFGGGSGMGIVSANRTSFVASVLKTQFLVADLPKRMPTRNAHGPGATHDDENGQS